MPSQNLLSITDVIDHIESLVGLRPSPKSIYRYISHGVRGVRLPAVRMLGRLFVDKNVLNGFFAQSVEHRNCEENPILENTASAIHRRSRDEFLRRQGVLSDDAKHG